MGFLFCLEYFMVLIVFCFRENKVFQNSFLKIAKYFVWKGKQNKQKMWKRYVVEFVWMGISF